MVGKSDVATRLGDHLANQHLTEPAVRRIVREDLEYLTNWVLEPDSAEELASLKCVIAFSFGFGPARSDAANARNHPYDPMLHRPGAANEALADLIKSLGVPAEDIFAQWEIAEALHERHGIAVPDSHIARPSKAYLGTSGVVKQFLDHGLRSPEYERIAVVAHRHHTYRCLRITEKALFDATPSVLPPRRLLIPDNPAVYDPDSLQNWTTSLEKWVAYEVGARFNNRYNKQMMDLRRDLVGSGLQCPQCKGPARGTGRICKETYSPHYVEVVATYVCLQCDHEWEVMLARECP
jgi:hypothetical protein